MKFRFLLAVLFLSVFIVLNSSCTETRSFIEAVETPINTTSIYQLNGKFKNQEQDCTHYGCSLWAQLNPFNKDTLNNWQKTVVELLVDKKYLNFTLLQDTLALKTKKIKYKIQDGFVVFKKHKLQGVPLLYYRYQKRKSRLSLDKENSLCIYTRGSGEGGITLIIFGSPTFEDHKFFRVK